MLIVEESSLLMVIVAVSVMSIGIAVPDKLDILTVKVSSASISGSPVGDTVKVCCSPVVPEKLNV